jgi:hypothetical protein
MMIGRVLSNRYKLLAELGSGGMAWVYLAEDQATGERIAIKVLYPQHSQDLGFLQRFTREAKLSMALSQSAPQQNVVQVLDYGADRDTHYLVMEYVPGRDLAEIIDTEGPLPWREALVLARQVALALDHAHAHEIVHRDIKPSNIMVLGDGTVRVLDFGIARARTSPELTLSGFVGSPNYAAPEQATGQPVDVRADIYSLGVVLYRMLSGALPFQGDTPWAVVNQHIASAPPPLREAMPDLPEPVTNLVEKMLAKRREDRFQSPRELVAAIDVVLAGEELPAPIVPAPRADSVETLYRQAREAMEAERWHEAVDLFSRVLKIEPDYRDVSERLSEVGQQIRLAALYRHAQRALENNQWQAALDQIAKIEALAPGYKDVGELRSLAERREPPPGGPQAGEPTIGDAAALAADASTAPAAGTDEARRRRGLLWLIPVAILVAAGALYLLLSDGRLPGLPAWLEGGQPSPSALAVASTPSPAPTTHAPSATPTPPTPDPTRTAPAATPSPPPTRSPTPMASPTVTPEPSPAATHTPSAPTAAPVAPALAGTIAFPRFDPARQTYDVYVCPASTAPDGGGCQRRAAQASQPDFLPGSSQLVVRSWQPDDKGLWVLNADGSLAWRITDRIEAARPSVDFRGESYVYHSRQEPDRQPRLYRTYGVNTRAVEREGAAVRGASPAWTPDGQILYSGCMGDTCGILRMRADGSAPRQIIAGASETNPEASPDGRQLAFMSRRDGNWEVYIAPLVPDASPTRLTTEPGNDGLPTWSPDGGWLAFVSDRDGTWAVWAIRPDGSGLQRLFPTGGPLDGQVAGAATYEIHGWLEERISWSE